MSGNPCSSLPKGSLLSFPDASHLPVLETPALRVSRPVAACTRCRMAKIKCDGKLPACTACERANCTTTCCSASNKFAKGKERSYVATLESKVERLEKKIHDIKCGKLTPIISSSSTSSLSSISQSPYTPSKPSPPNRPPTNSLDDEESNINDLVSDFGYLAVNSAARDFRGFASSSISYARLILAAACRQQLCSPPPTTVAVPSRDESLPLIRIYMDTIYTFWPFFDYVDFDSTLDRIYSWFSGIPDYSTFCGSLQSDNSHALAKHRPSSHQFFAFYMILAITRKLLSANPNDSHSLTAHYFLSIALQFSNDVLVPGSLLGIQALLFLTQYSFFDPIHFDCWTLLGAASRAMIDLGIHQDPPSSTFPINQSQLDRRRLLFHSIYSLDRAVSISFNRAISFSDDSFQVSFPTIFNSSQSLPSLKHLLFPIVSSSYTALYSTASQLMKLRQIQSTWYCQLYKTSQHPMPNIYTFIWSQYDEMTRWFESVSDCPTCPTAPPIVRTFELELLYSYIYLLSPCLSNPELDRTAKQLVFEHFIVYFHRLNYIISTYYSQQLSTSSHPPILTTLDQLNAYSLACKFLEIVTKYSEVLCAKFFMPVNTLLESPFNSPSSTTSSTPSTPTTAKSKRTPSTLRSRPSRVLPSLLCIHSSCSGLGSTNVPSQEKNDPLELFLNTIEVITSILTFFSNRFGSVSLGHQFLQKYQSLLSIVSQSPSMSMPMSESSRCSSNV